MTLRHHIEHAFKAGNNPCHPNQTHIGAMLQQFCAITGNNIEHRKAGEHHYAEKYRELQTFLRHKPNDVSLFYQNNKNTQKR
ncbi:MAG: hypothetical protein JKY82_03905 [Rhizobiaceae bacterium]|nr:hypothetical protein [Rhizobiaceae bacterium]